MSEVIRRQVTDNLDQLLAILPTEIRQSIETYGHLDSLVEVVLDLGRPPEARYFEQTRYLAEAPITQADLDLCIQRVGEFSGDNRAGIERTLHRISAIRNRKGVIIGLTCRVGRAIFGTIEMIRDLVETGKSILLLGRPGMGKTTALREIARVLADETHKRVVIIDTSNEIAGDGDIPHPAIGRARRMQVAKPELQHQVMIEAVENHMPEVIVIDEIGTELEALAARTIAERGVQLVGTAHGNQLANLIKNPTLSDLVGGIQSVTLGDEEARRRGTQKSILERKAPPTFDIAVEMLERYRWIVHKDVSDTIDGLLRGREPAYQIRGVSEEGKVTISEEQPRQPEIVRNPGARGWRASGRMEPLPLDRSLVRNGADQSDRQYDLDSESSGSRAEERPGARPLLNAGAIADRDGDVVYVYLYAVSRHQTEQVIDMQSLPIVLTKELDRADMVLALRSQVRSHSKLRHLAETHSLPIHTIKSSTIPQITRALRRMLQLDEPAGISAVNDLNLFAYGDSEDEMEALEETRLAVEQIVIPKSQPVELLPRSSTIRRMQHELVEHYHLKSTSFGTEPNRRLRIYPN
ncbi:R3H domain-containing nucleic acid-binding protein [Pseudanabaena sp. PCC 6802]|uniref:R3H domain-containing nucleic acid-binding protein n=1 Tax=Pseudanabaena sp. PCC 6802 TaxID=118173 RepID=UPI000349C16C|nr:R3H domain-containing nucleic acid-binding protein [Pseudanabaena sp. PCC 6802]